MLAWVAANGGVRAIGEAGAVSIRTTDWRSCSAAPALSKAADETVTGSVTGLSIPAPTARLTDAKRREYDLTGGAVVGDGSYRLSCRLTPGTEPSVDAGIEATFRFEGPAKVASDGETVCIEFPVQTPVTMGFSERLNDPATVTVPATPEGVATAVTHLAAAHRTTGPGRSHPSLRDHPPVVETGAEPSIPDAVAAATPETGIELRVPASLDYLFVAAPLAYYLGAEVTVADAETPVLVAPEAGVRYRFRELPTFQHGVARLLRQVFFFDTLVRDVGGGDGHQSARAFGLDPVRVRELTPAERLARYFNVSEGDVDAALPEWHFSTYAAPEPGNVGALPYLLDALSLVYLPESSELRGTELLERTLDDFYRTEGEVAVTDATTVVSPELRAGRIHAWLAPGAPIDAFKTTTAAYRNRGRYRDRGTPLSVEVVLNDDAMAAEHAAVADIYRDRAADLPLSVTVREHLTREELADTFAAPNDFVHYIGHCDETGLKCADGHLSTATLNDVRTRTFFLNACGSYQEGASLVEGGSVGGAVTLTKVLDRQAATVGTAFARLLVNGFGLEPAMQLSRRRIMMGKDYVVVGDGTYTLAPTPGTPVVGWLEDTPDGFELTCESLTGRRNGTTYEPPFGDDPVLAGQASRATLDRDRLRDVLADASLPIIYENEFHWSADLAARF
jgi:hypothetical protein